jgi:hypothetical protein
MPRRRGDGRLVHMNDELTHTMRELHTRMNDGIHVRLLWGPDDGRVAVTVADIKTGGRFAFDVAEPDRALHAFQHPFSYAAWHGIDTSSSYGTVAAPGGLAA